MTQKVVKLIKNKMTKLTPKEYFELDSLLVALLADEGEYGKEEITDISFILLKALATQNIVDEEEIFDYQPNKETSPEEDSTQLEFDPEIHL